MQIFLLTLLKKKSLKKIKYCRSSLDPKNSWCGHQQPYNFFPAFPVPGRFWITQENQNQSIRSGKISCNWKICFLLLLLFQKERFLEPTEKSPYIVNYWWACVNNYVSSTILVITKIYMQSQPVSIAWQQHLQLYFINVEITRNILIYELDVLCIFVINIVGLTRYENLFDFWFDKR